MSLDNPSLRAAVDSFLSGLPLPIRGWGDRGFVPPCDEVSVRVNLLPTVKGPLISVRRAIGLLSLEVWAPIGSEDQADDLASVLETAFLTVLSVGSLPLLVDSATAMAGQHVDGLWRVVVKVEWAAYG